MFSIEIDAMTPEHLPDVVRIEQASFSAPWSRDSFLNELTSNLHAAYCVARPAGQSAVVGYAGMWVVFNEAHITTLAVDPVWRRQQIGSMLLDRLMRKAFLQGARFIFLEVRDSNTCAQGMYEKFSFTVRGRRKRYYRDEDALVMSRIIG